jgi:hypothetical protein
MLRTGAKPVHTRQYLATQKKVLLLIPGGLSMTMVIDTRLPIHDKVQVMTAIKSFCWKCIAFNQLDTIVFGITKHQTIEQSKMTRVFG